MWDYFINRIQVVYHHEENSYQVHYAVSHSPPVGACKISEGAVNLNYGDIDEASLSGAKRSENNQCNL